MKLLQGFCRKISLPVLGAAAVGWVVFVIGFGAFNNGNNFYNDIRKDHAYKIDGGEVSLGYSEEANETIEEDFPAQRADADYFPYWCYVISFPVMLVVLVLHLILHNLYIFGVIGHLLLGLCLVCGSGVFWGDGRRLFSADDNLHEEISFFPDDWRRDTYYGLWLVVEWTGVFLSIVAMIAYMVLLPLYTPPSKNSGDSYEESREMEQK